MSFANLKKKSRSGSLTEKLIRQVEKINDKGNSNVDERIWKPVVDKSGNGYAIIRFLPEPEGCDLPWSRVYTHAFQGTGGWYIENSLTTLGQKDPVSEHNSELWNSGSDANKEIARKQKRRLSYYSNIYVVSDPTNPENEGKVFLYKYGKKIFDKIMESMQPAFEDETPVNPFDFWKGADFKLKITRVAGFWNYDKSEFAESSTLGDFKDKELEAIWKDEYSLTAFTADDQFKSYEDLKLRLETTLKGNYSKPVDQEEFEQLATPTPVAAETPEPKEEEDTLSYFAQLAKDD